VEDIFTPLCFQQFKTTFKSTTQIMIKNLLLVVSLVCSTFCYAQNKTSDPSLKLWYNNPANNWNEALPIGNGRLGAMVFGNPAKEQLQLNEETVWSGGPNNNITSESGAVIPQLRKLLFEEKFLEAQALADVQMMPKRNSGMVYQTVGNLFFNFDGHDKAKNYYRDLNIEKAIATVTYELEGVKYKREMFASFTDNVIIVRLTADKPGKISFTGSMETQQKAGLKVTTKKIVLSGITSDH
jgi:alpha-L-fucosidase 2